jgi:hypothetical protein
VKAWAGITLQFGCAVVRIGADATSTEKLSVIFVSAARESNKIERLTGASC